MKTPSIKKFGLYAFMIVLGIILLDQITKFLALRIAEEFFILPKIFSFSLVLNTGAGFGLLKDQTTLLIWLSIIALGAILHYFDKVTTRLQATGVALITGGLIGNLIDRIIYGHVIDFINFQVWPVFNIADSALTIGVIILIIGIYKR